MSDDTRSTIDKLFDVADAALSPLETVLSDKKPQENPIIDVDDTRHTDWEKGFASVQWATAEGPEIDPGQWHAFPEASMTTLCQKEAEITHNRQVLQHGKVIPACTSCILAVTKA